MKIINELYKNVRDPKWYLEQFAKSDQEQNILFIDPVMMNFDFYTMIIPYLALAEEEEKYKTAITGLYKFSEVDTKPQTTITASQVRWADVIVIPNSLEQFSPLSEEIRAENPKVKIIQTLEFDFYEIKNDHYLLSDKNLEDILTRRRETINSKSKKEIRAKLKEYIISRLEENLKFADRIIVLNHNLLLKLKSKGFLDVQYCPILIDAQDETSTFLENIDYGDTLGTRLTNKQFVLSCELREHSVSAFKEFIPQFEALKKQHDNRFKLVVLGDDPAKHFPSFDIDYTHLATGSIVSQFKRIWKSSADVHLILNKKNIYSSNSETMYSFVDRGMFGIPVATLEVSPLKEVIKHDSNGFILKKRADLIKLVADHIGSKKKLIEMSKTLKEKVVKASQVSDENLIWLGKIFFDFREFAEEEVEDE
jgi:hypothetical protein